MTDVDYGVIEDEIIKKLKLKIKQSKVESFPDNADELFLTHVKSGVFVHFTNDTLEAPVSEDFINQKSNVIFNLHVFSRSLRKTGVGFKTVYELLTLCKSALVGQTLSGFFIDPQDVDSQIGWTVGPLHFTNVFFVNQENGLWEYNIDVNCWRLYSE